MTQKEAIAEVLNKFGGKASLTAIYPKVLELAVFKSDSNKKATIRTTLQRNPDLFRPSNDGRGVWELISYQKEIATKDERIKELEAENERLRAVKKEDDFVKRLVKETKNLYKHEKEKMEVIRQILYKVGRFDAEAELDAYIEGKNKPTLQNILNLELVQKKETNIDKNFGPNIDNHDGGVLALPEKNINKR